jgi:hypothetical protein
MIIGNLIFGLIRAYAPKLLFMSIFGTIAGEHGSFAPKDWSSSVTF